MYFELFIILTLLIVGLLGAAGITRKTWPLLVAAILLTMTGAVLMSDGLRVEVGSRFDRATGATTYDFNALMPSNDYTVFVFANTYFYGGFIAIIIALGLLVWGRFAGVSKDF